MSCRFCDIYNGLGAPWAPKVNDCQYCRPERLSDPIIPTKPAPPVERLVKQVEEETGVKPDVLMLTDRETQETEKEVTQFYTGDWGQYDTNTLYVCTDLYEGGPKIKDSLPGDLWEYVGRATFRNVRSGATFGRTMAMLDFRAVATKIAGVWDDASQEGKK